MDPQQAQARQMLAAEVDLNTAQIEEREQGMRELEAQMYVAWTERSDLHLGGHCIRVWYIFLSMCLRACVVCLSA